MQLTQKERNLLQDQLHHEEVCIQKYQSYAQQAQDPQLKQLFTQYANQEQQHYNTISQLLGRQPQQVNQLQNQGQQLQDGVQGKAKDALLCTDMLMTEKYVSNAYDTTIFKRPNLSSGSSCSTFSRKNSSTAGNFQLHAAARNVSAPMKSRVQTLLFSCLYSDCP